jgi:DNA polymerase
MNPKIYKQTLLDNLYAPYTKCKECPLATLGRTHVVFGQGNPDAQLMIIGEGPGKDEDSQGLPFVGRSGQLLNKILEAININRSEIFITNIVKCRPPNNRQPLFEEMSICKKLLLDNQIKIIRPAIICTLGATAIQGLLQKPVKITQIRGQKMHYNNILTIPTYHPAYILRNPKELTKFADDLALVAEITESLGNKKNKWWISGG